MFPLNATLLRQRRLILGLLVVLAPVLAGTQANAQGDDLFHAAEKGNLPRVKALLAAGADVNAKMKADPNPRTSPVLRDEFGNAKPNAALNASRYQDGATALILASANGRLEVVRALLDANADVNARNRFSSSALELASWQGHAEVVRALLAAKADLNSNPCVLYSASASGNVDVMKLLLDAGADKDGKNCGGDNTPLISAIEEGSANVVRVLLEAGTDREMRDGDGYTPLIAAIRHSRVEVVSLLLQAGANKDAVDQHRWVVVQNSDGSVTNINYATPLIHAAANDDFWAESLAIVKLLLDAGANKEAKDYEGDTALKVAEIEHHSRIAKLLRNAGATE
jgi:ankyrin repeat protein